MKHLYFRIEGPLRLAGAHETDEGIEGGVVARGAWGAGLMMPRRQASEGSNASRNAILANIRHFAMESRRRHVSDVRIVALRNTGLSRIGSPWILRPLAGTRGQCVVQTTLTIAPDSTASVHSVTKSSISRESASGASSGTQCPHRATTSARTLTATRSSDGPQFLRDGVFIVCGILQPRAIVCKVTAERARCPIAAQVLLGVVTGDCRRIVVRGCRDAWETQNATSRPPLRSSSRILRSRLRRA